MLVWKAGAELVSPQTWEGKKSYTGMIWIQYDMNKWLMGFWQLFGE